MYADDTVIYISDKKVEIVQRLLQSDMTNVYHWLCANKLSLHVGKTNAMMICPKSRISEQAVNQINISVDVQLISEVTECQYLGVTIDQHLKFGIQLENTIAKLNRAMGILKRTAQYIPVESRKLLYNTLVLPHFDYGSTIWGGTTNTQLDRLQRIQNRAMRIILRCNRRTRVFDMLSSLRWMNVRQRIHFNLCTLMWKIVHGRTPNYLCNFQLNSDIHKYNTRSTNNLFVNRAHPNSLSYRGVRAWNALPLEIRDINNLLSFKRACAKHIFNRE
jgi:hypothetical protein